MAKNKKYSLNERVKHYSNIMSREYAKYDKTNKMSNKLNYAIGYVQGAERGLSLDYNKLSKFEKLGQRAGNNARIKSMNVKF